MGSLFTNYFLIRPQNLNHAGTLFGGTMMAWADEMAFVAASLTYPGCTFVTKVVREFNFVSGPIEGDIVKITAQVLGRGRSSVSVAVRASNARTEEEIFHTEAVLVNARDGKSRPIPEDAARSEPPRE